MRPWQILIGFLGLVGLVGCAGMSASECQLADWEAVGYEDGARGSSSDQFGTHRKNCAKHDVAPDFKAGGRLTGVLPTGKGIPRRFSGS